MLDDLFGLAGFAFGRCWPAFDLIVVEVDDFRGHDLAGNQSAFGEMDGEFVASIAFEDAQGFFHAPVALVHVGLEADGVDPDAGFEAALDETFVSGGHVEVVEQEHGARIGGAGGVEGHADDSDAAQLAADARDGVVVFVEDRHDDDFVDDVPHVDAAGEIFDIAGDAVALGIDDLGVGEFEEPIGADGVPAEWVTLDEAAALYEPFGGGQDSLGVGVTSGGFKTAPVKGEGYEIEELQKFFVVELGLGFGVAG